MVGPEKVYISAGTTVLAVDATTGEQRWAHDVAETFSLHYVAERLYELREARVRASTPDGTLQWETRLPTRPQSLHEQNGYVYVGRSDGYSILHTDTGTVVHDGGKDIQWIASRDGKLFGSGYTEVGRYGYSPRGLTNRWRKDPAGPYDMHAFPVLGEELLYVPERAIAGTSVPDGRVTRFRLDGSQTGDMTFSHVPSGIAVSSNHLFVSTTTITAGNLGQEGELVALDHQGARQWYVNPGGGITTPVVADGTVVVGPFADSPAPVTAFDADSGTKHWEYDVRGGVELAVVGQTVYVGDDTHLMALQ
ncbi:MAG: PQQ-binding-like beta-propeller repeat protein [Halobacteriaceae archaeon]